LDAIIEFFATDHLSFFTEQKNDWHAFSTMRISIILIVLYERH